MNKQILALKAEQEDADNKSRKMQRELMMTLNKQQMLNVQLEHSVCEYMEESPVEVLTSTPSFELVCESVNVDMNHKVNLKLAETLEKVNPFIQAVNDIVMSDVDKFIKAVPFNTVLPRYASSQMIKEHSALYGKIISTYQSSFPNFESVIPNWNKDEDEDFQEETYKVVSVKLLYGRPAIVFYSSGNASYHLLFDTWESLLTEVSQKTT